MKTRLLLLASFAALVISACGAAPVLRNQNWLKDTSLITGQPCASPCWRGITPGETLWDDAIKVIESDTAFSNLQVENAEDSAAKGAGWQPTDGEPCCQLFSEDGRIVDSILLRVAPDVRFGEVVKKFGEPDYLIGTEVAADQAVMNVFYLDPPMLLYIFVAGAEAGALSESSEVIGILYLKPNIMQQLVDANNLHGWLGYQSYRTYNDSEFVTTVVPTSDGTTQAQPEATQEETAEATSEAGG